MIFGRFKRQLKSAIRENEAHVKHQMWLWLLQSQNLVITSLIFLFGNALLFNLLFSQILPGNICVSALPREMHCSSPLEACLSTKYNVFRQAYHKDVS